MPNINFANSVRTIDNYTYYQGGVLYEHVPLVQVLIGSESDLNSLTNMRAGTIAYTAGVRQIWQLGTDGTWVEV